jgi:hypothetical protein
MTHITCCNQKIEIKSGKENGKTLFYAQCPICNKKVKSEKKEEVEKYFQQSENQTYQLAKIPDKPQSIVEWGMNNLPALMKESAQFIDKPATRRMIEKNLRYVSNLSGSSWDKIWKTPEGQESINYALSESLYHAAILPEMGSIVPFGGIAEFIPGVECYKFALEQGNNSPFADIQIDLIHEKDKTDNYQEDGNFHIEIKRGIPRGEIIAVVVSGIRNDTGKRIGEIYDVDRLLEKAKQHSPAYRNYLQEKAEFTLKKVEGKLKKDAGGEYYEKNIEYQKDGKKQSWNKKVYEHDITNPYDGPDRPEMLRKAAGKSFFRPYMKVRNAAAMAQEWQQEQPETREQAADQVLNRAAQQFSFTETVKGKDDNIQDAEIVEDEKTDESATPESEPDDLFDETDL